ncbi:hypothetical protein GE061_013576 [Apolygus lucorum]|uniref:Uncharacterized protein n=1 Tax=Apolygus lucorum TaxID=248454 RepID=A0A8S9XN64_APOLU|nr:hypothetical protein GE061_013576 [Apolygus lucorum]
MDLIYMSENFAFESVRAPHVDRYRQTWYDYESETKQPNANKAHNKIPEKGGKQHCRLCQEKSKKSLSNYIRQKSTCDAKNCITEEEE